MRVVKWVAFVGVAVVFFAAFLPWQWKLAVQVPAALCAVVAVAAWTVVILRVEARKMQEARRRWMK